MIKSKKNLMDAFLKNVTNNSNKIEYTEFISALIEKKEYLKEETLMEIFKNLDKNGNGKINKDDLKNVLNINFFKHFFYFIFFQKFL